MRYARHGKRIPVEWILELEEKNKSLKEVA